MKRILMSICFCICAFAGWAQVEARYDKGRVPIVNGRVTFQKVVPSSLDEENAYARICEWARQRFVKPNVIVSKFTEMDETNHALNLTAEEYLVFTNKFFVLDRTRINYWLGFQFDDGAVVVKMTRINYWYEEEREGGLKFSAEEFISDDEAFNRKGTKLLKDQGKFRKGTIDFFESIVAEAIEVLAD